MNNITDSSYELQFNEKKERLSALLMPFNIPEIQAFRSPKSGYRMRAEFRIWHNGTDLYHIMFDQQNKERYRVDNFPPACDLINKAMPLLLEFIKNDDILRFKLFQVDYLATKSNELLISLLYHKKLDESWSKQAVILSEKFAKQGLKVYLIARASKQKIVLTQDFVTEQLQVKDKTLHYRQVENSFTQPNATICEKMLEWSIDCVGTNDDDLLELYCGNGNFSIALAPYFNKVLATEISKSSVESAQVNIKANNIDNLQIIRMSAEDFTSALNKERDFFRLKDINLDDFKVKTIFVDPPRAGLDEKTLRLVQQFDKILYISCNPHTLCENLELLTQTHTIKKVAFFDQFPFTHHIESGVLLQKI